MNTKAIQSFYASHRLDQHCWICTMHTHTNTFDTLWNVSMLKATKLFRCVYFGSSDLEFHELSGRDYRVTTFLQWIDCEELFGENFIYTFIYHQHFAHWRWQPLCAKCKFISNCIQRKKKKKMLFINGNHIESGDTSGKNSHQKEHLLPLLSIVVIIIGI